MGKRIELTWPHKGEHVLEDPATRKWGFAGKFDLQGRPLIEVEAFGTEKKTPFSQDNSNLLILGENLFALETLTRLYADSVQFIYIDPPFNTGQEFEAYDDNYNHSVWLSMMEERLEYAYALLSDKGSIAVEIDDSEQAYLKVLLDEQFGRENFIATISVKRSAATGHKAINPGVVNVTEYIHLYAKDKKQWRYTPLTVPRQGYDKAYNQWIENPSDTCGKWKFNTLANAFAKGAGFADRKEARRALGSSFNEKMYEFALTKSEHVIRFAIPNYEGVSNAARKQIDASRKSPDKIFHLEREGYSDMFFRDGNRILFLRDKMSNGDGESGLVEPLTNFWADISWQGIANEGSVELKKGKKPERLIKRFLDLCTGKDDLVIDFFGGSATTAAVAHKMGRRWILIENESEQIYKRAKPRLLGVLAGKDATGISTSVGWKGGGGFRLLTVGAPLIIEDKETKQAILNPTYDNGALVRAVCSHEGFLLTGDELLHGRNGEHFCHVTEEFVDYPLVKKLARKLPSGHTLTVYAIRYRSAMDLPRNVDLRKLDKHLAERYSTN